MFESKTFLRIGALDDSSMTGLFKDSHELLACSYAFSQEIDMNGKAQSEVSGGTVHVTYPNIPPVEITRWMLNPRKYENGAIVICDENNFPLEKIFFERAACIAMEIEYIQKGKSYAHTKIVIQAQKLIVGTNSIVNNWK